MDPLSNPLILSNIFEQLPLDGKKSFRQVCPLWEDSTLQSWRNNALVKIVKNWIETNSDSSSDSSTSESEGIILQEFVELIKTRTEPYRFSENKPFRSFKLQELHFPCPPYKTNGLEDEDRNGALVESLFEKIGPTIHRLHLDSSVKIRKGRFIDAFKWILLKACVNLKALHIDSISSFDKEGSGPPLQPGDLDQEKAFNLVTLKLAYLNFPLERKHAVHENGREFWNIIPNLKNLDLDNASGALGLIKQLKHPLESGKFIKLERFKLQSFDFDCEGTSEVEQLEEMTKYIRAASPPLSKIYLKLNLSKLRKAQDSLKAFFESCKDTLASLSVLLNEVDQTNQSEPKDWITELSGVTLPNLTFLYLQYEKEELDMDWGNAGMRTRTRNFDFGALQGFPKLKKLTVQLFGCDETVNDNAFTCGKWLRQGKLQYGNVEAHSGDDNLVRNELMEDFTFWSYQKFDCDSIKKLASWMPSIKYLAVDADDTTLPVILNSFSELKRLSLLDGSFVWGRTLQKSRKTYPGIEINELGFEQSFGICKMPEYF